ncbi:ABC transporter substrate-binding protein [Dysosmobacter sp.]|uniref:ABC transporter substrate-binding protein n=1 Tax=Dysosmobacter sp. TaxID=2591382 RepID=UPI002A86511C|nr:ABC transporter substrate-binding protein [Dysosmobacter sp.]MDY3281876.1 ABC transporter substrate-binding protein [Dysosmobacter sp.]
MNKKKLFSLLMACTMAVTLLAGCGGGSGSSASAPAAPAGSASAPSAAAFKLGATGPLTGGAAIYGNAAKNGAQIAVDEINAAGGAVQFELQYQDDTHDAEKAVNAYNKLKDWGMQISLGSVTSKPCEATAAETYADRIFALTPSASATAVTEGKDNMFQMCFMDPNQGSASAQYISEKGLGSKIAIIWKNDDVYSKGIHDTFTAKAAEMGLEIVSDTTFADGNDTDFSVQLSDAQSNGADLVFLPMYYQPASLIFAQAASMSYAPTWFGVDGMDGILTMEGFDPALAEGVILLTPFNADSTDSRTQAFVAEYQKRFGEIPNQFAADAYDCVYAYKQALEAAGATADMTAEQLCGLMIQQFTTMTFDGLTGDGMTWDANGQVSKSPKGMIIQNGAYVGLD